MKSAEVVPVSEGFLFLDPDSANTDPASPSFEVVVGHRINGWIPESISDTPLVCGCGKCTLEWDPMFVLESGLILDDALQLVSTINKPMLKTNSSLMWLLVFVQGESPVSIVNLGGKYR